MRRKVAAEIRFGINIARLHIKIAHLATDQKLPIEAVYNVTVNTLPNERQFWAMASYIRTMRRESNRVDTAAKAARAGHPAPTVRRGYHD